MTNNGTINGPVSLAYGTATLTNTGTINSYIDASSSTGATLINSGTITSTILADGFSNHFTLILLPGSSLPGGVNFTNANNGIIRYTVGQSFAEEGGGFGTGGTVTLPTILGGVEGVNYTIERNEVNGIIPVGAVLVSSGGRTLAVTPDIFAGADQVVIRQSSEQAVNLVNQRQQIALVGNTNVSSGMSAGDEFTLARGTGWVEGFGSYKERPQDGDAAISRTRSGGGLTGVDLPENDAGYRSGFYVGGFSGSNDLGETKFRSIDSHGALGGVYVGHEVGSFYISGQLAVGYADNSSDRKVGVEIASADYDSHFISPSVSVLSAFEGESVTLIPSLTVRYMGQYAKGYTEDGSSANQTVESHTSQTLGGRAQVEAQLKDQRIGSGTLSPVLRVGLDGETSLGQNNVDLVVLGTNVSLDPSGGNNSLDGIVGANIAYKLDTGPEIYADGEANLGLNNGGLKDNMGGTARLGARWKF